MQSIKLDVKDMSCNHCVNAIEGALKEISVDGKADLNSKTISITFDESKVSVDAIKEAIEEQGYEVG